MTERRDCTTCGLAVWKKTKAGKLHPSGDGRCGWKMPVIVLPASFYYSGFSDRRREVVPPDGGYIERHSPYTDCPTWMEKTQ